MSRTTAGFVSVLILLFVPLVAAQDAPQKAPAKSQAPEYKTLFYKHDGFRLEAYFYKPQGKGPFPLVVYNHGSWQPGKEGTERPAPFIARILVPAGYALLVPERRGYGKSEGAPFSQEIGTDRGERFVKRLEAETGDVNAAVDYAKANLP